MTRNLSVWRTIRTAVVCLAGTTPFLGHPVAFGQTSQILEIDSGTLTSYLPSAGTPVQGVKPLVSQRGVEIDGSLRRPPTFSWAINGNPFGAGDAGTSRIGDMDLATGAYAPTEVDWAGANPGGARWVIGRSYNQLQASVSDGPQGRNWFQMSQPELVRYVGGGSDDDVVYIVYGADRFLEFKQTGADAVTFKGKNGAAGVVEYVEGSPDTYVYFDQRGTRTYFFGGDTSNSYANWQIWKIVDAAGNMAYVGDSATASTAASSGYTSTNTFAYDAALNDGRRYTYTYASSRLTQVKVETKSSGTWASPSGLAEVARIMYEYYSTTEDDKGTAGDLKLVTVRTTLSDSGATLGSGVYMETKQHYRYYTRAWSDSDGRRGNAGELKFVIDREGCRKYDWDQDSTLDDDFLSATDANLKPYAAAFFEYANNSSHVPVEAFFNGECGCSGGTNGTYEFTYEETTSSSFGGGYDTDWATRVVVRRPDGTYLTQYFDEIGQTLSTVVTNTDPAGSPTQTWVTQVVRNSSGQVTEVRSPKNTSSYTHNSGSPAAPDGTIASQSGTGLITVYDRVSSGDMSGFVAAVRVKEGTSTSNASATLTSDTEYSSSDYQVVSGVNVIRPFVSARRSYHTATSTIEDAGKFNETVWTTAVWGPSNTSVENLAVKQVTEKRPLVATANNGADERVFADRFFRKDGTVAYTQEPRFEPESSVNADYTAVVAGLPGSRVSDIKSSSTHIETGDAVSNWSLTLPSGGLDVLTVGDQSYDAQGRLVSVETPIIGGVKASASYFSRLADGRMVSIQIPRVTSGPTTYYGPVSYSVANHAGQAEFSATVAIAGITTALGSWIDETQSDPLAALDVGTPFGVTTNLYSEAGNQLEESRTYHDVPATGTGSAGSNYDATKFMYDAMGRRRRVKTAAGTITLTTFDALGRTSAHQIGTNDADENGTDDMVTTEELVYDAGSAGGNSHLTKRTLYVQDSATAKRETTYDHDYRGRLLLTTNPQAPHALNKHDNLGRVVATGLYSSAPSLPADPTDTSSTNRVALSETFYDEMGRVYKTTRHEINQSTWNKSDSLDSLTWFDALGRVIKTQGEGGIQKATYDRLGRATHWFTVAYTDDTAYSNADDVTGDKVLEEQQTYFDDATGLSLYTVSISRWHDDASGTGALDSNADSDRSKVTEGNLTGRPQITAMWYDELNRAVDTVAYGTFGMTGSGSAVFDRGLTNDGGTTAAQPTRSATKLRTTYTYNDEGTLQQTTDPRGKVARTLYDDAGRKTAEIRNFTNATPPIGTAVRDTDSYTRYTYANGLMTEMWVDFDGDGTKDTSGTIDQVTTYTYGTTKGSGTGDSRISTGHLLQKVQYPDSSDATNDVVKHAYNAQGQAIYQKDQNGTEHVYEYDTAGRPTHDCVVNPGTDIDTSILRISTTYLSRGTVDTVTQYNHATVGSGTAKDQVQFTFDGWGNVTKFEQDVDSAIAASGRAAFDVEYTYSKVTPTGGWPSVRRATMVNPTNSGWGTVQYDYGSTSSGAINHSISRVETLERSSTPLVEYRYIGAGMVATTWLHSPYVHSTLETGGGAYGRLDRFNRVTTSHWASSDADVDFYKVDLTYDENSNIQTADDALHETTGDKGRFDALYTVDGLDRLTNAREGHLSGGTISTASPNDRTREQEWELDQVGNWLHDKLDLDGSGGFETDWDGDFNAANEITSRTTSGASDTLAYDAAGHMTEQGLRTFVYDAWGRLKKITREVELVEETVVEYTYNGLGHRTSWKYDNDNSTGTGLDGVVDGYDHTYWYCYDERWRVVAMYRDSDSTAKVQYVYHAAGQKGMGTASYTDLLAYRCRDIDEDLRWSTAGDGALEEERWYCQNWRADVSVIVKESAEDYDFEVIEWVKYSAYGKPWGLTLKDYNRDGTISSADSTDFNSDYTNTDSSADITFDGTVDILDSLLFAATSSVANPRGTLSYSSYPSTEALFNLVGYAGYQWDPAAQLWHVRHRVLHPDLGRWMRRDPLGYVDGTSLYSYVRNLPLVFVDPMAFHSCLCRAFQPDCMSDLIAGASDCKLNNRSRAECLACCAARKERYWQCCMCERTTQPCTPFETIDLNAAEECEERTDLGDTACRDECNNHRVRYEYTTPHWALPPSRTDLDDMLDVIPDPVRDIVPYKPHDIGTNCSWRWQYVWPTGFFVYFECQTR
jgi:RHS repeat-associated protein